MCSDYLNSLGDAVYVSQLVFMKFSRLGAGCEMYFE